MKKQIFFICTSILFSISLISCSTSPEKRFEKATRLANDKHFTKAINELNEVIAKKPNFAEAYLDKGKYILADNEKEEVNKWWKESNGDRYYRFKLAIKNFTKAIELNTNHMDRAFAGRGSCYFWMNNYSKASLDLKKAIKLNPEDKKSRIIFVWSKIKLGDTAEAKLFLDRIIKKYSNDAESYYERAVQELLTFKDKKGACKDLKKAEELYNPKANYYAKDLKDNIKQLQNINCKK